MNYRPIIKIINSSHQWKFRAALFQALIFKNNLFNAKYVSSHVFHYTSHKRNIKGAVCRILTLLKHKNTIICLQTFRKHVKLTYLFIWKTMLQSAILLWKCASGPECLCLLWFVKPAHCQFTQLYFGTPGCQLAVNTAYFISFIVMCARSCWCP